MDPKRPDERLLRYIDLLLSANQRMNLTRIATRDQAMEKHVADAMTLLPFLPQSAHRLADVGSGGGLPGIPLAIARPDASITLIESTKKKAVFLRDVARELELTNVKIDDRRAELVGQSDLRESFDVVVARAVATMNWLVEWCLPLARTGGKFLAMKGPKVAEELPGVSRAIEQLGGAEPIVHSTSRAGADHHVIIEIRKLRHSNPRFPRDPTIARGNPL